MRHNKGVTLTRSMDSPRHAAPHIALTIPSDRAAAGYSPVRVEAVVWAFSELLVEPMNGEGIFEFYRGLRSRRAAQQATTCSNRASAWLDGVVRDAEEEGLNHQVLSFKSPADTPAIPGMLRKSTAFVPRYQKFESISLQRRVHKPSVPQRLPRSKSLWASYPNP